MSHELRKPPNPAIGLADVMESQAPGPLGHPTSCDDLDDIRDRGAHWLLRIDHVLALSKMDTGALELSDNNITLADAFAQILRSMSHQAETGKVSLSAEIEPYRPGVKADRVRLRQILSNLVSNAFKFTPEGGMVCVRAKRHPDGLAIMVSDTGIGIAPADIPRRSIGSARVLRPPLRGCGLGFAARQASDRDAPG
jgi:signal transduction histidine kinase